MTDKATIEYIICANLRPTFLIIEEDGSDIKIIISTNVFSYYTIEERINVVFSLLLLKCPDIVEKRLIVIEAYDSAELDEILEHIFDKEL